MKNNREPKGLADLLVFCFSCLFVFSAGFLIVDYWQIFKSLRFDIPLFTKVLLKEVKIIIGAFS